MTYKRFYDNSYHQMYLNRLQEVKNELWELTADFTIFDWRTMRTKEYWEIHDKLSPDEKNEHILKCVKKYRKEYRNDEFNNDYSY